LSVLTRGELARQESTVSGEKARLVEDAKSSLGSAVARLRRLSEQVEVQLRQRGLSPRIEPGELTEIELGALQTNINYQFARALRNQAQCYPADSADRSNSLSRAIELLDPLAKMDTSDPAAWSYSVVWNSRLYVATCYRLLADGAAARRQLGGIMTLSPPAWVQLRVMAERLRLALGENKLPDALALVGQGREIEKQKSPRLDYAILETYLAAWRLATKQSGGEQQAKHWQAKASGQVRLIDELYGPYWTRRAEMLLAGYVREDPEQGDLGMLVRAAESSFRSGRPDESIEAYRRAAGAAAEQGNTARAFELRYIAATIDHQRGRHAEAAKAYGDLAREMPSNPAAAEAHLLAIHHAAQFAPAAPQASLEAYEALIEEHVRTWPKGPTANRAWRRLGRLREHRGNFAGAIEAYRSISRSAPDYAVDVQSVERCCKLLFAKHKASVETSSQIAAEAAAWFESLIVDENGSLPKKWTVVECSAASGAARMWLDHTKDGYGRAERIIAAALRGAPDAPARWKSTAQALLIRALAGGGKIREASDILGRMTAGPADELLALLEGLGRVGEGSSRDVRSQLADLQLRAVGLLREGAQQLDAAAKARLDQIEAEALASAGRTTDAIRAYEDLAKRNPRDAGIQEAYARQLSAAGDRASLLAALAKWRELAKHSAAGSELWFRAKYSVALMHYRLGEKEKAATMIKLLKLTRPDLGGREMREKFEQLLARCRG